MPRLITAQGTAGKDGSSEVLAGRDLRLEEAVGLDEVPLWCGKLLSVRRGLAFTCRIELVEALPSGSAKSGADWAGG